MTVKILDLKRYELTQIIEALTCPVNRHCTRVEHCCDDVELFKHPDWLITHYVENGGAEEFAKRRKEFEKEIEVPDSEDSGNNCSAEIEFFI